MCMSLVIGLLPYPPQTYPRILRRIKIDSMDSKTNSYYLDGFRDGLKCFGHIDLCQENLKISQSVSIRLEISNSVSKYLNPTRNVSILRFRDGLRNSRRIEIFRDGLRQIEKD